MDGVELLEEAIRQGKTGSESDDDEDDDDDADEDADVADLGGSMHEDAENAVDF